jgi:hypothetical protein
LTGGSRYVESPVVSDGRPWHYAGVSSDVRPDRASSPPPLGAIGKLRLLRRVWVMAARVQIELWRSPLPVVARPAARRQGADRLPTTLLSLAVSNGLRIGPWRPRCLLRSLVLYRLLTAEGVDAELVIGLRDGARTSDAHAWVEVNGRDVGPVPGGRGYQELTRFPRAARPPAAS